MNPLAQRIEQLRQDYNRQLIRGVVTESIAGTVAAILIAWSAAHHWGHLPWVMAGAAGTPVLLSGLLWRRLNRYRVSSRSAVETIERQLQLKERLLTAREWFDASTPLPRFY